METLQGFRSLIIPDCHIPFEDRRAYELMLFVAHNLSGLKEIIILGDYADFYDINSHGKDPAVTMKLREERVAVCKRLKELQVNFPDTRKIFIEGNHEYRLARYLANKAPELFDTIRVDEFLGLEQYGFEFVPYGPDQQCTVLGSELIARHEPIGGGVHCAHSTVVKASNSVIFGHTHRIQESQIVSLNGDNYRGISSGWLGDKDHPVFKYVKNHHQWALAFSIVTVLSNNEWFNQIIQIIPRNGKYYCVVDGYFYEN